MQFHIDFAASVPKNIESPELNEDAWAYNDELTCVALSDGASESFDSKCWAQSLVQKYARDQCFDLSWVDTAVSEYANSVDFENLGWAAQGAYGRGSFATLLGLTIAENGTDLDVLCVGDTLAAHVRDGVVLSTYPFVRPEEFNARPTLVSTKRGANAFLSEPSFFTGSSTTWSVLPGDVIYAVTDAVGQWLLAELASSPDVLTSLKQLCSETEWQLLVHKRRDEQRMKLDDSTIIRLVIE